jgi:hypothetical protein
VKCGDIQWVVKNKGLELRDICPKEQPWIWTGSSRKEKVDLMEKKIRRANDKAVTVLRGKHDTG